MPGKGGWRAGGGTRSVVIARANGVAPVGLPPAPSWLSSSGKLEYRKLARELVASGIATRLDSVVVAAHADAVSRLIQATSALASSGPLMRGRDGLPVPSPWVKLARDARVEVLRTAAELGLTPASRGRVKMADAGGSASTPIGRMLQARADGRNWWELDDDPAATPVDDDDDEDDG
jgi:P27 family predicted phage terminase small subunit